MMMMKFASALLLCLAFVAVASAQNTWRLRLGNEEYNVNPIPHNGPPTTWYNYDSPDRTSMNPVVGQGAIRKINTQSIAMVETTQGLYLAVIYDKPGGGGGKAQIDITCSSGGCAQADFVVKDDPPDFNRPQVVNNLATTGEATLRFHWDTCCTDGFMYGPLHGCFELTIQPTFHEGWSASQVGTWANNALLISQSSQGWDAAIKFEGCEAACEPPATVFAPHGDQSDAGVMPWWWTIDFISREYDGTHTTFTYHVTSDPPDTQPKHDLQHHISHFVIGSNTESCAFDLGDFTPNQGWEAVTQPNNQPTKQGGFKNDIGHSDNEPVVYKIVLEGDVEVCTVPYTVKGGPGYAKSHILGPCCGWEGCPDDVTPECAVFHPHNPLNDECKEVTASAHPGENCVTLCFDSTGQPTPCSHN
eukprot:TRINITY_DN75793_c0_g1_i1.p1 TRINITY_DN75793_c0_g1~~TRINITY_DN75793_c0_g1_i1.p1  ORF type:complete len:430 (+),score=185.38 TRINITY_DN75793_c0_g1_i1:41-1291(+)